MDPMVSLAPAATIVPMPRHPTAPAPLVHSAQMLPRLSIPAPQALIAPTLLAATTPAQRLVFLFID
jgi:hypothetical protein